MIIIESKKSNIIKAKPIDYLICLFSVLILFLIGFYFVDSVIASSPKNKVAFNWELKIPFYPLAFIPYFGIFVLPLAIPFYIVNKRKLYRLTFRLLLSIIVSAIIFICFPCELSFPPRNISESLEYLIILIAGKYNLVPSLHVCLTYIICTSLFEECRVMGRFFLIITMIILPFSTLFCHQHHVVDVLSGLILGVLSIKLIR